MALGASRDLLIVDDHERPLAMAPGRRGRAAGRRPRSASPTAASWGDDIRAIGTFLRDAQRRASTTSTSWIRPRSRSSYYYRRPGRQRLPGGPIDRLAVARDVSEGRRSAYIDGDIFVTDDGEIVRFVDGRAEGWETDPLPDELLRKAPAYRLISSASDRASRRPLRLRPDQRTGRRDRQGEGKLYRAVPPRRRRPGLGGSPRACTSCSAEEDAPPTLVWATKDGVFSSILDAVPDVRAVNVAACRQAARRRAVRRAPRHPPSVRRAVIPLRDANPVRRTPIVTIALIVACIVAFAYRLGVESNAGEAGIEELFSEFGVVPAELMAALASGHDLRRGDAGDLHQHVPPREPHPSRRQPHLPVDLRQQHRGPPRTARLPPVLPRRRRRRGGRPDRRSTRHRRSRWSARPARSRRSSARTSSCSRVPGSCRSSSSASSTS